MKTLLTLLLGLTLSLPVLAAPALTVQTLYRVDAIQASTPSCRRHCHQVDAQWPVFAGAWQWVNPLVAQQLAGGKLPASGLAGHYQGQLRSDGEQGLESVDRVTVKDWTARFLVLDLSHYQYPEGAAHGMEARTWLTFDQKQKKLLQLDDVLVPGQREALKRKLYAQYQQQVQALGLFEGIKYADFADFDGWWLDAYGQLHVQYGQYAIAPYAAGHPELTLDRDALKGIVRPGWLPRD
jgi:hypothetical protein